MNLPQILGTTLRAIPWLLVIWTALMALLFALLEIQIEGPDGWAAKLPTWRLAPNSPWRKLFGGRPITGYHVYAFAFMAAAFHLPLFLGAELSLRTEARILASLALFWGLEDFLWFVLNPAYGLMRFKPCHVPWHPYWLWGVPVDYLLLAAVSLPLYLYSRWPPGGGG